MAVKHVIIHVVMRNEKTGALEKNLRATENKMASNEKDSTGVTAELANSLIDLFGSSSLNVGEFGINSNNELIPPFEQALKKYYTDDVCSDFVKLTQALSEQYYRILIEDNLTNVKGGYLVFYQYKSRNNDWLAIAIVNKTEGIDVHSQSLDVIPSEILDLQTLHLAAAINLTKWM
jgi:nucleoid-associated protein